MIFIACVDCGTEKRPTRNQRCYDCGHRKAAASVSATVAKIRGSFEDRFWSRVDKNGELPAFNPSLGPCWCWIGNVNKKTGYGHFGDTTAHRIAYELANGEPVPSRHEIDHLCRVRHCVRPQHLEVVTYSENGRRGARSMLNPNLYTVFGKSQTLTAWSKEIGVGLSTLSWRLHHGQTLEEAVTAISDQRYRKNRNSPPKRPRKYQG